jgi:hypothetical protein
VSVSSSDNIASNDKLINEEGIGKYVEGNGRGLITATVPAFIWSNCRKPQEPSDGNWSAGPDMNPRPPRCEPRRSTIAGDRHWSISPSAGRDVRVSGDITLILKACIEDWLAPFCSQIVTATPIAHRQGFLYVLGVWSEGTICSLHALKHRLTRHNGAVLFFPAAPLWLSSHNVAHGFIYHHTKRLSLNYTEIVKLFVSYEAFVPLDPGSTKEFHLLGYNAV